MVKYIMLLPSHAKCAVLQFTPIYKLHVNTGIKIIWIFYNLQALGT